MNSVAENLSLVTERIVAACSRVDRDPSEVKLVGITKMVSADRIREAIEAGLKIFGENYVKEALKKQEILSDENISWHFVGHLQTNKAKFVVSSFEYIHTVDRESLAYELDRQAHRLGTRINALIQVNTGYEKTKSGVRPEVLKEFFKSVTNYDGLRICGLMCLPPYFEDPEKVRPHFRLLRQMLNELKEIAPIPENLSELSMGMSHDFDVAIEEGATLIRVGTALFGERPKL